MADVAQTYASLFTESNPTNEFHKELDHVRIPASKMFSLLETKGQQHVRNLRRNLAKIKTTHHGAPATVFPESENQVRLEFDAPVRAVTPGQAAVLYQDEVLLGGGWINDSP